MKKLDYIALISPILLFIEINIIGRLFLTELILFLSLFFIKSNKRLLNPTSKKILLLLTVWLIAQITTDAIRATPLSDFSRGWSKIIFIGLNFVAVLLIIQSNKKRLMLLLIGFGIGIIISLKYRDLFPDFSTNWKMGWGLGFTVSLLAFLSLNPKIYSRKLAFYIIFFLAFFSFFNNARSLGGMLFISALYLRFYPIKKTSKAIYLSVKKTLLIVASFFPLGSALTLQGMIILVGHFLSPASVVIFNTYTEHWQE